MNQAKALIEKELMIYQNDSRIKVKEYEEKEELNRKMINDLQFKVDMLDKDKQYW